MTFGVKSKIRKSKNRHHGDSNQPSLPYHFSDLTLYLLRYRRIAELLPNFGVNIRTDSSAHLYIYKQYINKYKNKASGLELVDYI